MTEEKNKNAFLEYMKQFDYGRNYNKDALKDIDIKIIEQMINNGADVNVKGMSKDNTILIFVCEHHLTKIAKLLIENGADVNVKNDYNLTAILSASRYGHIEIVELLIKKNADLNIQNKFGDTALIYASMNNHIEIVKLLIENGANIDLKNKEGRTALDITSFDVENQKISGDGFEDIITKSMRKEIIELLKNAKTTQNEIRLSKNIAKTDSYEFSI